MFGKGQFWSLAFVLSSLLSSLVVDAAVLPLIARNSIINQGLQKRVTVETCDVPERARMALTPFLGGFHGSPFSDCRMIMANYRIGQIAMTGCGTGQHITGLAFGWRRKANTDGLVTTITAHGTSADGIWTTVPLDKDDYVTAIAIDTRRPKVSAFKRHTRIGYLEFRTKAGLSIACGVEPAHGVPQVWSGQDMALMYLSGREGDALDALRGHFVPLEYY